MSGIASARLRRSAVGLAKKRGLFSFLSLSLSLTLTLFCLDLPVRSYLRTTCMLHASNLRRVLRFEAGPDLAHHVLCQHMLWG